MHSFAYYRLPYADSYTTIESDHEPLLLPSYDSIGGEEGFVIAPFMHSDATPIVMIRADKVCTMECKTDGKPYGTTSSPINSDNPSPLYTEAFTAFHDAVSNGQFRKLVLARTQDIECKTTVTDIFERACQMYPRLMIMLFHTPQTGTWIIASPEILIEGMGETYHTVALAGTMPYREGYLDWSVKNKAEQHIVEQYIADTLSPLCCDVLKDGPVTSRAGNLVHLRTDFRFHLKTSVPLGTLVGKLHPTPAVCGLPKHDARRFIADHEGIDRRYYSGFAGPVGIHGETHLYVSLRCAELQAEKATLYAGGGIMPDSTCLAEWQETENKMQTINNVLQ